MNVKRSIGGGRGSREKIPKLESTAVEEPTSYTNKAVLAKSLSNFQAHPSFNQLDKEALMYILKRDDLEMKEVDLFRLALQWAKNQPDATVEESLQDILPLIRFPTMTPHEFATTVIPTKVLPESKIVELFTYFRTDDKAKRRLLDRTIGFNTCRRQPKDWDSDRRRLFYSTLSFSTRRHYLDDWDLTDRCRRQMRARRDLPAVSINSVFQTLM